MATDLHIGDRVYLVPRTPQAPREAYRDPPAAGLVAAISRATTPGIADRVTLQLDSGERLDQVHPDNLTRRPPRRARSSTRRQHTGSDDQAALFDLDQATIPAEPGPPAAEWDDWQTVCACEYGPCSRCAFGDHHLCAAPPRPIVGVHASAVVDGTPETWITNRSGIVIGPAVWLADRKCRWRCNCECHHS